MQIWSRWETACFLSFLLWLGEYLVKKNKLICTYLLMISAIKWVHTTTSFFPFYLFIIFIISIKYNSSSSRRTTFFLIWITGISPREEISALTAFNINDIFCYITFEYFYLIEVRMDFASQTLAICYYFTVLIFGSVMTIHTYCDCDE